MWFQLLCTLTIGIGIVMAGRLAERRWSARPSPSQPTRLNLGVFTVASVVRALSGPLIVALSATAINRLGGGMIVLPSRGWGVAPAVIAYILVMDLVEYLFHRAQHASPMLWTMHSLHHSDPSLGVSTTVRHAWPEYLVKAATIYLCVGLLFKVNAGVIAVYGFISVYNYFVHADLPVGFGRWTWLLNCPQYHRLHHSRNVEHFDCNFAALFPVYDLVFGTYRRPKLDEYPASGLASRECPSSVAGAIVWPLRLDRSVRVSSISL